MHDVQKKWNDPNADAATRVQQKLDAVKGVMIDNIGRRCRGRDDHQTRSSIVVRNWTLSWTRPTL